MPTTKPRIGVTLPQEHYDVLARLARLQGVSMSSIVADLVAEMAPILGRVCEAVELAARAQVSVRDNIRKAAADAEASLLPHAEAVRAQYEAFSAQLSQLALDLSEKPPAGAGARRRRRGAAPEADPRPVITGVRKGPTRAKGSAGGGSVEGCTCTVTRHERQENPSCPVHFPRRAA